MNLLLMKLMNIIKVSSKNLIFYVNECESDRSDVRIASYNEQVVNIIKSILDFPSVSPAFL